VPVFIVHSSLAKAGHFEDSQVLDFTSGDKCSYVGATNGETLAATDVRLATYSMGYIYDNFEYSHCDEDFQALLETLHGVTVSGTFAPTVSPTRKPTTVPTSTPTAEDDTPSPTYSPEYTYTPSTRPTHRPTLAPVATVSYCT
jgi:hypothetical protein